MTTTNQAPAQVEQLKPCPVPWCGGNPARDYIGEVYLVRCIDCDCCGPASNSEALADCAWNQRPERDHLATPDARMVEALELLRQATNALSCTDNNDPLECIADNGMTVWDAMLVESNRIRPRYLALLAALSPAPEAADRIEYLEKRLEVVPGWSESVDGISCRDDTIHLLDERIERQANEIAGLREALEKIAFMCETGQGGTGTVARHARAALAQPGTRGAVEREKHP